MHNLANLIAELKRRRVFRVAVVYAGVAFIIFQIVDATFEPLHIPNWVGSLIIILLLLGFPVAVGLAWAFDITDRGIARTPPKEAADKVRERPQIIIGNKTLAIVAALAIAAAVWSWWQRGEKDPLAAFEHSVAVMPFDNLTGDTGYDIWQKGIPELPITLINISGKGKRRDGPRLVSLMVWEVYIMRQASWIGRRSIIASQ